MQQLAVIATEGSSARHFASIASAFKMPKEFRQNVSGVNYFSFNMKRVMFAKYTARKMFFSDKSQ